MARWNVGPKNGTWKGGRSVASNGYVLIRVGVGHHLADCRGYAYEHRLVAEEKLGRRLAAGEVVHHIDHDRENNAPENLEVMTAVEHRREHRVRESKRRNPGETNTTVLCECSCGAAFLRFDRSGRPRRFVSGHNPHRAGTLDGIVAELRSGSELGRAAIAARLGLSIQAIAVALSKLKRRGVATNSNGKWRLTDG